MKIIHLTLFLFFANYVTQAKVILPPSATINGGTTVCQNATQPLITFTGSGGTAPYTFTYKINGGLNVTVTTTSGNSVTVSAPTGAAGSFTYSLVSVADSATPSVTANVSGNTVVTVNPQPDATINGTGSGTSFGGVPVFRICNNTVSTFTFTNGSTTASSLNTNYTIVWGDSSPNFTSTTWTAPITHTYQVGLWNLTYTIQSSNGCNITKNYIVFVGSNPAVSLGNPGNTDICNSSPLTFPITGTTNNPPGTTYTVSFNDGSTPQVFNHPPPSSVTHTFSITSCGVSSSNGTTTFQNSFSANIVAENPCGASAVGVVPIYVSTPPIANFTLPTSGCLNTQICLSNTSAGAYENFGSNSSCNTSPKFIWTISPLSGYLINSGSLGNDFGSTDPNLWTTGTSPLCLSFSQGGTYTITIKIANRCGFDTEIKTICIQPPLTPQFTLNNNSGCITLPVTATNTTNLTNQCGTPTYLWAVTYAAANCGTASAFNYTGGTSATSASPSFNFTEAGTYTITLTATNSCGSNSTSQTVTVKKPPTITSLNGILPTYCGNATINPTATIPACALPGILTYTWTFTGGTPATSNSATPGPINYPVGGPYTVSLTVSNVCGNSLPVTQQFTVNVTPVITNSPLSQTICSGSSTTLVTLTANPVGTTFTWTASATAGITGFSTSGTSTIPVQTISTTGTSAGTVTYTIIPTIGTCVGATVQYVVTVNPAPTITAQPTSSTVCLGGTPTVLSVTLSGATGTPQYQWYSNVAPSNSGGTLITGATSATYNPPATPAGTLYYYCIITLPTGGCSSITSNTATVTITPLPTVATQPTPVQNVCVGVTIASPLSVTFTGGIGTATYQWYSNSSNATSGGTLLSGATNSTYTPPVFSVAGAYFYYVVITLSGNGCGSITSNSAQVTVFNDPTITTQPLITQTLCQGATPTTLQVVATGGNGTFSYQWYSNLSNTTTSNSAIASATNASFIPPTTAVGTTYYYCIVSQPATPGCSVTSATAQVIINAAPTIQNQPASSTICLGGTPTVLSVTYTNGVGTPSYQWYSNTTNSTTGGSLVSGATNATYSPPNSPVGTIFYYCVITLPSSGGCSSITSSTANVTINAGATISLQPTPNQSLCVGATIPSPLTISYSGGTGTASYQWYSNGTITNTGGALITGATNSSYAPPVFTSAGTFYYYAVVTLSGNGCGPIPSDVAEVIIVADPIVTTQPLLSQTVCQTATATSLNVSVSGGINAVYSYQWYSNSANSTSNGALIAGATNATYLPPTANVGTTYYYCIITQTNGSGCTVTSGTAAVIVNLAPTFTSQPASSTICLGGTPTILSVTYANGVGTPSYQWYSNVNDTNTGGNLISGATNATYSPPNSPVGTLFYYCIISLPSTGGCSSIISNTANVTINAQATITLQPTPSQSLCVGATILTPLTITYTGGTGTASYQWYSNGTSTNTGGALISGATNSSYTPVVFTSAGTFYYYAVVTLSGNGCGPIPSDVAEIIIVADPIVTTQPLPSQTVCQNVIPATLSVSVSGGIGTSYLYQWYSTTANNNTSGSIISGETTASFIPSTSNVGTNYYYCIITQTNGLGCNVTSATAAVIVNLAPVIATQPASSTICIGQTATLLSVSYLNGVGIPQYQWYSNTTNTITGSTPITGATITSYNPQNSVSGTTYYYCVITFPSGGCSNITSNIAEVIVNENPVIASQNPIICSGNSFTVTPNNSNGDIVPIGTTYTWTNPSISPVGAVTGASAQATPQTTISQTLINTTISPSTVTYTVTPTSGVCVGNSFTITVTVNPSISPNVVAINNACFGVNTASISTNITGGIPFSSGPPYIISWTGPNGFASSASTISGLAPGIYNLSVADFGGCPFSNNYTITEPSDIVISTDANTNITCFGNANGAIAISVSGGTGAYTYSWIKNTIPYATTDDISNLAPGTYTISVSDANNCGPRTATFTITEPPILAVNLVSQTNVDCYGFATGAITINTIGGTPIQVAPGVFDYAYSWTGPNGFTSANQNLNNLLAGTYNLTVTDDLGCTKNLIVTITQSTEIIIATATTPIVCYGDNNATITATLSGGNPPYQFQWSNLATSQNLNNLSPGDYIITVTDNLGCQKIKSINIPSPPIFTVTPVVTNISCFGANNGSIVLNFVGGIAPVNLVWSDGSTAGTTRNNLAPGTYSVTITDSKPCTIFRTFTIVEPQPIVLSANLTNALDCINPNSGAINLIVSGGTPPFTYSWSNGSTTEDLNAISSGNFLVTVTDVNGCVKTAQYTIVRPAPILIAVTTQTDFNCQTHQVNQNFVAQVSGGVPPFQLQWSSGTVSGTNNEIMHSDVNGTVLLTVTDSYGCIATYTVDVATPVLGYTSFDTSSYGYITYGIYSIGDPIQFQSTATGDYESVIWDFGDGTFSTELNPIHTYIIPKDYVVTQTVTYPFGCVYVQTITLIIEKGYVLVVPTAFTPNDDSLNDTFRPVTKALKNVHLDVYDTWGSLIYSEVGDVLRGWDAKIKGFNAENGNYYSKVSAETFYGTIVNSNQTFVLIR